MVDTGGKEQGKRACEEFNTRIILINNIYLNKQEKKQRKREERRLCGCAFRIRPLNIVERHTLTSFARKRSRTVTTVLALSVLVFCEDFLGDEIG